MEPTPASLQPLPLPPETQGTRRGGGTGWAAAPLTGTWRAGKGRALMASDEQSRPVPARMPRVGSTPVRRVPVNHAAEGRGSRKAGPIRGIGFSIRKSVLLTRVPY